MGKALVPLARTPAHEALLGVRMDALQADVARLTFRVLGTRLDGLRDRLLIFFVGVVLFRVAAPVYFLTQLLVAAAPVVMLASFVTISCVASNTSRRVALDVGPAIYSFLGQLLGRSSRTPIASYNPPSGSRRARPPKSG